MAVGRACTAQDTSTSATGDPKKKLAAVSMGMLSPAMKFVAAVSTLTSNSGTRNCETVKLAEANW